MKAYDDAPEAYAHDWEQQPAPVDLHALVREYFWPGPTADIGCGSGRDTAWLFEEGFESVGYDASLGLVNEARRRHPGIRFEQAGLPDLEPLAAGSFTNVLCETVIMHLGVDLIGASVRRLLEIVAPGGALYLSWRVTRGADHRDENGRLYTAFDSSIVLNALAGAAILHDAESTSASSGKTIQRVIARAIP